MDSQEEMNVVFDASGLEQCRFVIGNDASDIGEQFVSPAIRQ